MAQESGQKSETAKREETILHFWKENKIFDKSLSKNSPKGEFVFYDGPPFATGLPHYGSLLSSIVKDVIPRYKTMRGYHVRRRWGWDCHGLPIENMIEKELGLKSKKDIEELGVEKFNKACRASVLRYVDGWKEYIDRIGRWTEYDNAYKTMDNSYMESIWWALKKMHDKKLLYEGRKVLLYCPHCETPLARAEVQMDNSYKDITEEAVTVKFKVKDLEKHNLPKNTYLLAWTTTPWTLPGNVALAVGIDIDYVKVRVGDQLYILAEDIFESLHDRGPKDSLKLAFDLVHADNKPEGVPEAKSDYKTETVKGRDLIGLEYEPLYEIDAVKKTGKRAWYVTDADFVTTEEGTGIVHTAVIYGEDDYQLGQQKDLPMIPLLDASGHFNKEAPETIQGKYFKSADKIITDDIEERGLLFDRADYTHSYPHCHRCDTPLLYNAITSWFINIQKVKRRLLRLNERVNWFPKHLKHGRFLNILKDAPDWTISRNRYWASPLPIWKCDQCSKLRVIGSVDELKRNTKASGNSYFLMRHGGAQSNELATISTRATAADHLTDVGKKEVERVADRVLKEDVDLIVASPFVRTKETAKILHKHLGLKEKQLIFDKRLGEFDIGPEFYGKSWGDYYKKIGSLRNQYEYVVKGGETRLDVRRRATELLYELEQKYRDKKILIVSHEGVIWEIRMAASGASVDESIELHKDKYVFKTGEVRKLSFVPIPHTKTGELDLHRPYIDDVVLTCVCGADMRRIPEVVDGWVESASMPFAEYHYPFENKSVFKRRSPGDFVAEYVAQTRTWFYYMHVIAGILFRKPSFTNVVSTGNILGKDGFKMSKSKGNYTDPLENLDGYGADALRYYLMVSTVMQGEDIRFLDSELREAHNRVVNILWNVATFYKLYADKNNSLVEVSKSDNVLDLWILARLSELTDVVTTHLDLYDTVHSGRPIRDFIEDLSTWYVRRSRGRFKSDDVVDREAAITTLRSVLLELSKIVAPFMPFIAESVYSLVRDRDLPESVHLESWPKVGNRRQKTSEKELLSDMEDVREVVSRALEARVRAGIKVRQPLALLTISVDIPQEYRFLIEDEVNIKKVAVDTEMIERVRLDTEITDELQEEGNLRDFIRYIQGLRKEMKLDQKQNVKLIVGTDDLGRKLIDKFREDIKKTTLLSDIVVGATNTGTEVKIGEQSFILSIQK